MPEIRVGGAPPRAWLRVYLSAPEVEGMLGDLLYARGQFIRGGNVATATAIASLYAKTVERLRRLEIRTAEMAEQDIRAHIDQTQVRPDPIHGNLRMRDAIVAVAWDPEASVPIGFVGMGKLDELDQVINRNSRSGEVYWRTQEYGYSGHVGRTLHGVFQPGGARPSQSEFRVHPAFEARGKGQGKRYKMVIRRPIRARHFLRDGTRPAVAYWKREVGRINVEVAREVAALIRRP